MMDTSVPHVPQLTYTEVDGVPTVWSSAPGPLTAALLFRVGRADEDPVEGGITHLVEHLAMAAVGDPRYECNAFVEGTLTVFFATCSPAEMTAFLETVTRALSDLPLARLDRERVILRRESEGNEPSASEMHRHLRYGMSGHGMVGQPEFGLKHLAAPRIAEWSTSRFTLDNATLWLTGPPPEGLRLHLPAGQRFPPPIPEPIGYLSPPHRLADLPGIGLGFELPRERGAGTFMSILHRRLRQRLRMDEGLVYGVVAEYEPLDATTAIALVGADCDPGDADPIAHAALQTLDELGQGRATAAELEDELSDVLRAADDPTAVAGLLDITARDELLGMPRRSPQDRLDEQRATTVDDVANIARHARRSMILLATMSDPPRDVDEYPTPVHGVVSGRELKPLLSVLGFGRRQRLVVGPDGVSLREADGAVTTILYRECVLLEKPADDEIVLWSRDGDRIYIPGIFWRGGKALLAEIEASVPASRIVRDTLSPDLVN